MEPTDKIIQKETAKMVFETFAKLDNTAKFNVLFELILNMTFKVFPEVAEGIVQRILNTEEIIHKQGQEGEGWKKKGETGS